MTNSRTDKSNRRAWSKTAIKSARGRNRDRRSAFASRTQVSEPGDISDLVAQFPALAGKERR